MVGYGGVPLTSSARDVSSLPTPVMTTKTNTAKCPLGVAKSPSIENHLLKPSQIACPPLPDALHSQQMPLNAFICYSLWLRQYPSTTHAVPICSQMSLLLVITSRVALCSLNSGFLWTMSTCILMSPTPSEVTAPVTCPLCSLPWHNIQLKWPSLAWMSPTLILSILHILDPLKEGPSRSQLPSSVSQQFERSG